MQAWPDGATLAGLLSRVAEAAGVTEDDLSGPSRKERIVAARQIFCCAALAQNRWTAREIGKAVQRDHSTVSYSRKTVDDMLKTRRKAYTAIMLNLNAGETNLKNG